MPRKMNSHWEDPITTNAPLIREFIERGEAYLGVQPKARLRSLQGRLTYLKRYAYHMMTTPDADPYNLAACTHLVMRDVDLDWQPALSDHGRNEPMINVYWRPNLIMAARKKAGYPVPEPTPAEQDNLNQARELLLKKL